MFCCSKTRHRMKILEKFFEWISSLFLLSIQKKTVMYMASLFLKKLCLCCFFFIEFEISLKLFLCISSFKMFCFYLFVLSIILSFFLFRFLLQPHHIAKWLNSERATYFHLYAKQPIELHSLSSGFESENSKLRDEFQSTMGGKRDVETWKL